MGGFGELGSLQPHGLLGDGVSWVGSIVMAASLNTCSQILRRISVGKSTRWIFWSVLGVDAGEGGFEEVGVELLQARFRRGRISPMVTVDRSGLREGRL